MNPFQERGFTLIEMVIAFAILGLTLTALYRTFDAALSRSHRDSRVSEATLIAQSLLAREGTDWPVTEGTREVQQDGYLYKLVARKVPAPPGQRPFTIPTYEVTAFVSWSGIVGQRSVSISTLKLAPRLDP